MPSITYSLFFAPIFNFSEMFPDRDEPLVYIKSFARQYTHIRLNTTWDDACWDETTKT